MPTYGQADRPIAITTPLGKDVLLLNGFRGHETISQLFHFQLDLLAESTTDIKFDKILGQSATVEMRLVNDAQRHINGIVKRFSQGGRTDADFIHYSAELVPKVWLLTKSVRSRIFQHLSIPDILKKVFAGFDVTYEIATVFKARDYCVQYRESDFDFASRLMEEEGIYYFFKHTAGGHQLVVTDHSAPVIPGQSTVVYEELQGGVREDVRILGWEKSQELRAGECTLWDHSFELPTKNLEARQKTVESVTVGKVTHKLKAGGNENLEIYDYPGGYAQRFDGTDKGGSPQPAEIQNIFEDSTRTVKIRMEQETVAALDIRGKSNCGQFNAGHKFTLTRHFNADGQYLLTRLEHDAQLGGNYRSDAVLPFRYENQFTCIPAALRYRPQRLTRRPAIAGIQTAMVVGPAGEEVFVDRYGRVKVQFYWDREGKKDPQSSCWLRVAQIWAGKGWGGFFWPRIGHEVVVSFEEGDPDQPLIVGSVYNGDNPPPFQLPAMKNFAGIKSASVHGNARENYNGVVFVDEKGKEHLAIHSERHLVFNAEYDTSYTSGRHIGQRVPGARTTTVGRLPGT
jgi:type VI secretion system secreted protein VgrG